VAGALLGTGAVLGAAATLARTRRSLFNGRH